jgi:hypothetical protein
MLGKVDLSPAFGPAQLSDPFPRRYTDVLCHASMFGLVDALYLVHPLSCVRKGSKMRFSGLPAVLLTVALVYSVGIPAQTSAAGQSPSRQSPPLSSNQTVITNRDVVSMVKAGLAPETVAAIVRNFDCQCDTSPAALAELKTSGVPDNVILAIVQKTTAPVEKPSGLTNIRNVKTVCLVNQSTDFVVFDHLPEKLKQWGRWTIVERPEDADLLLVFSATYDERSLIAVDRVSQRQLMGVNCDRRMPAQTVRILVNRMRKQIEKLGDTQ